VILLPLCLLIFFYQCNLIVCESETRLKLCQHGVPSTNKFFKMSLTISLMSYFTSLTMILIVFLYFKILSPILPSTSFTFFLFTQTVYIFQLRAYYNEVITCVNSSSVFNFLFAYYCLKSVSDLLFLLVQQFVAHLLGISVIQQSDLVSSSCSKSLLGFTIDFRFWLD
jgi:hypothetical protein